MTCPITGLQVGDDWIGSGEFRSPEASAHANPSCAAGICFAIQGLAMTAFFKATFLYVLAAVALTSLLHADLALAARNVAGFAAGYWRTIGDSILQALPFAVPLLLLAGFRGSFARLRAGFLAAMGATFLQVGFLFFKSAIPQILPFYADPFWAAADRLVLFGHDAWELTFAATPASAVAWFPTIYLTTWSLFAYAFPIVVAASDTDVARVLRFVWLFFLSWVVNGNLLATAGSSVGPVYYDRLLGGDRFEAMHEALLASGFTSSPIARLQARIWDESTGLLSYISAFPSMHVAVACIVALYVGERSRFLWPIGLCFLSAILWISVYSGYHYFLDGMVAIGVVLMLNQFLKRRFPPIGHAGLTLN